jgi:hypothetical protein
MGRTKKDIRIIKKDSNKENYTFVSDKIVNNVNNLKNNPSATTNNEKIHTKKVDNKGRKILGKSLQGHSPIYE